METKIKSGNLFIFFISLVFITLSHGCSNEPDNVVTSADGVKIAFNQQGKGNPAIIFIHGWANPKEIWNDQVTHFSQKYRAVAIDLYGQGDSRNNMIEWTMPAFGDEVVSVVDKLKLKQVVLVGFSMGTTVAIEAANKMPDKVLGVILVDDLKDPEVKYPPEMIAFMDSVMLDLVNDFTNEKLVTYGFYKTKGEAIFKRLKEIMPDTVSQEGWMESIQGYFKWINEDLTESVKRLKVPVVSVNSDMEPVNTEAWRKYVPSYKAYIINGVGHLLFWENPDEFNRILTECIEEFQNEKSQSD